MAATGQRHSSDDAMPPDCAVIEVRVGELKQIFNSMDPAPFWERDLDPAAVEYIVESAQEVRAGRPLGLIVHLDREPVTPEAEAMLREAVHEDFKHRAVASRRQLRQLLRVGRMSLLIGLLFLAAAIVVGDLVVGLVSRERSGTFVQESLIIGGWVALWRPLEIFLYDWWPIRAEARLYDRLSVMPVRVVNAARPLRRSRSSPSGPSSRWSSGPWSAPGSSLCPRHSAGRPARSEPLIAWGIAGTGMLMLAFVFQTLSRRRPDLDAGIYAYAKAGFGNYLGFASALGYWIVCCLAVVACLVLIKSTLGAFFPVFGDGTTPLRFSRPRCSSGGFTS